LAQFKLLPFRIDYMALFLPTTCIMVILAITRYDLLEIKSLARSKVFEAGNDAILLLNSQNRILDYNDSANRLFQRIGINPEDKCLSAAFAERPELLKSMESPITSVIKLPIGDKNCYYEITTESTDDKNALRGWIKTIRDVTEIYLLNEELHRLAMTDELSVLSNRRAFIKLGKEWVLKSEENSGILYLLMLDLDHFKDVNDQYGHLSGDLAIREFAQLLKNHFNSNSLVARLGGEEFAVLLESQTDDEVVALVRSFLSRAERHIYNYSGVRFNVTVSIGVTKKQPGQMLESMMQKADRALYQSKEHGRNRFTVL
ncbi:MAG TPA: sensor domain-containing diguanylate cyclase, partial [Clostridiales bacterium]|nr:sensor domain-containing diguanylate cyclase [Clostridiales bacterium]